MPNASLLFVRGGGPDAFASLYVSGAGPPFCFLVRYLVLMFCAGLLFFGDF